MFPPMLPHRRVSVTFRTADRANLFFRDAAPPVIVPLTPADHLQAGAADGTPAILRRGADGGSEALALFATPEKAARSLAAAAAALRAKPASSGWGTARWAATTLLLGLLLGIEAGWGMLGNVDDRLLAHYAELMSRGAVAIPSPSAQAALQVGGASPGAGRWDAARVAETAAPASLSPAPAGLTGSPAMPAPIVPPAVSPVAPPTVTSDQARRAFQGFGLGN